MDELKEKTMKTVIALMFIFSVLINSSCTKVIDKEGYVNVEGGKIWYLNEVEKIK